MSTATADPDDAYYQNGVPPDEPPEAKLEFISGSLRGEVRQLAIPGVIRIGCGPECEVHVDPDAEPFVSHLHAEIRLAEDRADVTDLGSSNGTYLNGRLLEAPARLHGGDILELGASGPHLRFAAKGEGYAHDLVKRTTAVLPKPKLLADSAPKTTAPRRRFGSIPFLVALGVLAVVLAVLGGAQWRASSRQAEALAVLRTDLDEAKRTIQDAGGEQEIGRVLAERFGQGVFLLALRVKKEGFRTRRGDVPVGHLQPAGTAWACDEKGYLATNGHVAVYLEEQAERHAPYIEIVAVQNETGAIFRVQSMRPHPKFDYDDPATLVYDAALVTVDRPVPVALPLASRERCLLLGPGETVYSLGFPIETMGPMESFYGYDSPERVVATIRQGVIQRATTADGRLATPAERRLVHIGIATVGGQSGSPVIDRQREVVALLNATVTARFGRSRIPHPGLLAYSVRIDALWDLLDAAGDETPDASPAPPATIADDGAGLAVTEAIPPEDTQTPPPTPPAPSADGPELQ